MCKSFKSFKKIGKLHAFECGLDAVLYGPKMYENKLFWFEKTWESLRKCQECYCVL